MATFIQEELVDNLAGLLVVMRRPDAGENKIPYGGYIISRV